MKVNSVFWHLLPAVSLFRAGYCEHVVKAKPVTCPGASSLAHIFIMQILLVPWLYDALFCYWSILFYTWIPQSILTKSLLWKPLPQQNVKMSFLDKIFNFSYMLKRDKCIIGPFCTKTC